MPHEATRYIDIYNAKTVWAAAQTPNFVDNPLSVVTQPSWLTLPDRLSELPSRIIAKCSEVDLSVSLIESRELPQLWKMFQGRKGLVSLVKQSLGGSGSLKKRLRSFLEAYRSATLGTVFGFAPTVRDAMDITNAILSHRQTKRHRFVVSIRDDKIYDYVPPTWTPPEPGNWFTRAYRKQRRTEYRVDGAFVEWIRPQYNTEFFSAAQTTIDRYLGANPLGSIWAVLPLSFAIDWILAVDDVLDSLWLLNNRSFNIQYWSTTKIELIRTVGWFSTAATSSKWGSFPVPYQFSEQSTCSKYADYNRQHRDPPSPLSSVRAKGAEIGNLYLSLLIALGLRRGK
jgi:hypothetical protein